MRVSLHGGSKGSAKHNEHDFEAKHIDKNKKKDNYYVLSGNCKTCEEAELYVYTKLYSDYLAKKNKEHINRRQYDRVRDMSEWLKAPRYRAREEILQIGDMNIHGNMDDLKACMSEYNMWKYTTFSSNCKFISASLHADESTPHVHQRETWFYHDKDGNIVPGLNKALEEMGIPLPNPNLPEGKKNNRLQTYTDMCRKKWQEICISYGFEIETEPDKTRVMGHMGSEAYKAYQEEVERLEVEKSTVEALKAELEAKLELVEAERKQVELEKGELFKKVLKQEKKEKDFQHKEDALDAQARAISEKENTLTVREKEIQTEQMRYKLNLKAKYDEKMRNYKSDCDERLRIALKKANELPKMSEVVETVIDKAYVPMRIGADMPAREFIQRQQQGRKRYIEDTTQDDIQTGYDYEF